MPNVYDVAGYVIDKCNDITTMKLQKLVYYCQAWSLAWDDEPLFDEDFEAWANGPVCPELFAVHKGHFRVGKDMFPVDESVFENYQIDTMNAVLRDLADKSPQWLSDLTHSERPWQEARGDCPPGVNCDNVIDKELIREYYGGLQ